MNQIPEANLTLVNKKEVARNTLLLQFDDANLPDFKAGQFISLKFGETSWRAYSILSAPQSKTLDLLVRLVEGGLASGVFAECKEGDVFTYRGPFGHFVLRDLAPYTIFCATGTGIAPIWSMIQEELKSSEPRSMEVWYGGRDSEDIAYLDEMKRLQGVSVKLAFSQTQDEKFPEAYAGRITQFVDMGFPKDSDFYICGNGDMVKTLQQALTEKGVDKKQVFKERFN